MTKKRTRKSTTPKRRKPRVFEGLPVVDATDDISLVINKADIAAATVKDPGKCAAALAGRRELKRDVRVFLSRMYVKDEKHQRWVRLLTPSHAAREIVSFDRGSTFEPGEYKFKAPSPSHQLGVSQGTSTKRGSGNKPKQVHHMTANVRISARGY